MANYTCILLDVDNTLLDFNQAERLALTDTLTHYDLPHDSAALDVYHKVNGRLWASLARGELNRDKLFTIRFAAFLKELGITDVANSREINDYYEDQLGSHAETLPGAIEALEELSEVATLAIVSNGSWQVQKGRIEASGIGKYMDGIYVSEKVGANKPSAKIFEVALRDLGITNRARVLVVGDDLLADIKGGQNAGLDTCLVDFQNEAAEGPVTPKYTVSTWEELYQLVMEPEELENVGNRNRRHMNDL